MYSQKLSRVLLSSTFKIILLIIVLVHTVSPANAQLRKAFDQAVNSKIIQPQSATHKPRTSQLKNDPPSPNRVNNSVDSSSGVKPANKSVKPQGINNASTASFQMPTPPPSAVPKVNTPISNPKPVSYPKLTPDNKTIVPQKKNVSVSDGSFQRKEVSSRASRREVMRQKNIPTSQQFESQSRNAAGREYIYSVPLTNTVAGGRAYELKSVQQQTLDRSHLDKPHWEAGKVKTDPRTGEVRYNKYNRPKLSNEKSKEYYDEKRKK